MLLGHHHMSVHGSRRFICALSVVRWPLGLNEALIHGLMDWVQVLRRPDEHVSDCLHLDVLPSLVYAYQPLIRPQFPSLDGYTQDPSDSQTPIE
jgi:hypothetical protein